MRIPFVLVDERAEPSRPGVLVPDVRGRVHLGAGSRSGGGRSACTRRRATGARRISGLPKLLWFVRERAARCGSARAGSCSSATGCSSASAASWRASIRRRRCRRCSMSRAATGRSTCSTRPASTPTGSRRCEQAGSLAGGLRAGRRAARRAAAGDAGPRRRRRHARRLPWRRGTRARRRHVVAGTTTPSCSPRRGALLDPHDDAARERARAGPDAGRPRPTSARAGRCCAGCATSAGATTPTLEQLAEAAPLGARGALVSAANPEWGERHWASVPPISLVGRRARSRRRRAGPCHARIVGTCRGLQLRAARFARRRPLGRRRPDRRRRAQPRSRPSCSPTCSAAASSCPSSRPRGDGWRMLVAGLERPSGRSTPMRVLRARTRSARRLRAAHAALRGGLRGLRGAGRGIRGVKPLLSRRT